MMAGFVMGPAIFVSISALQMAFQRQIIPTHIMVEDEAVQIVDIGGIVGVASFVGGFGFGAGAGTTGGSFLQAAIGTMGGAYFCYP